MMHLEVIRICEKNVQFKDPIQYEVDFWYYTHRGNMRTAPLINDRKSEYQKTSASLESNPASSFSMIRK